MHIKQNTYFTCIHVNNKVNITELNELSDISHSDPSVFETQSKKTILPVMVLHISDS